MLLTKIGKITLAAVLLQAVLVIALEASIAAIFLRYFDVLGGTTVSGPQRGVPVYLAIFICAQIFQIIMCWDAIWHKNTIQIGGFVIFNFCTFIYSLFQYFQMIPLVSNISQTPQFSSSKSDPETLRTCLLLIPILIGIFQLIFLFLSWRLYIEFGWKIYKKIGADPKMRSMYRKYQIFLMLLKLDVFFVFGFGIQFLVLVIQVNDPEFALTIIAMPVMVAILALAVYGVRREDKWIMSLFMFGLLCAIAYFLFKLIRIWTLQNKPEYQDTKNYLTLFSCISLIVVTTTFINAILCTRNFGKGLKEALLSHKREQEELRLRRAEDSRRMSLEEKEIDNLMM